MNRLITVCAVDSSACPKRQAVFCALAMSLAQTNQNTGASSSLESARALIWMYTANAATVSELEEFANLSARRIAG